MTDTLIIRGCDRAIFERDPLGSFHDRWLGKKRTFRRLVWAPYSFWFGGRLVRTGEVWEPSCDSEYDVINKESVIEGCKMLAKRKP